MNAEFSRYPICDTDMWVYLCLSDYCNRIFDYYGKLVFADVVEQEILQWENKNEKYKHIARMFKKYKADGLAIVIQHEVHISPEDMEYLEQSLKDLDFKYGLKSDLQEKNKGEFVSALYADHFGITIMKTNDGAFREGGKGREEFPDLKIMNWYDVVEEFGYDQNEKIRIRKLVEEEEVKMGYFYTKQKSEKKKQDLLNSFAKLMNQRRI